MKTCCALFCLAALGFGGWTMAADGGCGVSTSPCELWGSLFDGLGSAAGASESWACSSTESDDGWDCDASFADDPGVGDAVAIVDFDAPVHGRYVEVRSASVFAGACHANGEVDSQGRRALMGFVIDDGAWNGVDLGGLQLAVAIGAEQNLSSCSPRRAVVYVDESVGPTRREAAVDWLATRHGTQLGRLTVVTTSTRVQVSDGQYTLVVGDIGRVEGRTLADKACCSMPENIWYEPLMDVRDAVVGNSSTCRFGGHDDIEAWTYQNENNAFVASF